jgi:hypothetical protein
MHSATVSRHPAIALLLASCAYPQQQATVIGTALIYLLASIVLPILLMRWRRLEGAVSIAFQQLGELMGSK